MFQQKCHWRDQSWASRRRSRAHDEAQACDRCECKRRCVATWRDCVHVRAARSQSRQSRHVRRAYASLERRLDSVAPSVRSLVSASRAPSTSGHRDRTWHTSTAASCRARPPSATDWRSRRSAYRTPLSAPERRLRHHESVEWNRSPCKLMSQHHR